VKRVIIPELLDTDSGTPAEIAACLSDLNHINRWFGGIQTTASMMDCIARKSDRTSLSLLDVASGSGFTPKAARESLRQRGITIRVTLMDRAHSHLRNGSGIPIHAVAGDALALPFADSSFDVVSCCLFVHHLQPPELVRFVEEGLRVSRLAVLINDLVRHPVHLALVYAGLPLFHSRLTHHDAPASVKQAYTPEDMRTILRQTRAARVEIRRHFLFRMGVIVWKCN
jgi:ubiquinone/menaquinone biosynthesis C-methylase UbiE